VARAAVVLAAPSRADAAQPAASDPAGFIASLRIGVMAATAPGAPSGQMRTAFDGLITDSFDLTGIADAGAATGGIGHAGPAARLARVLGRRMAGERRPPASYSPVQPTRALALT
jgi:hypothetical protein